MVGFANFGKAKDLEEQKSVSESSNQNENQTDNKSYKFVITEDFLDEFMSKTGHGTISKVAPYNKRIPAHIDYLNLYMEKFGIKDTHQRMAHFLGQVAKETKFWSYNEDFIFGKGKLSETFKNFKTEESKPYAEKWEYKTNSKSITKEIQIQIANYAYARPTKASDFNNVICDLNNLKDPKQDGYNYRGRGLIQITGRNNYGEFQAWYNKHQKELELEKIDFLKNPDKVLEPVNVVLSAIYFWDKNNLNTLADKGIEEKHILAISNVINSGEDDDKKKTRKDYVLAAFESLKNMKEEKNETKGKWRNPLDRMELRGWYKVWAPERSIYGDNISGRTAGRHDGLDLYAPVGTKIYSCVNGKIADNYWSNSYGNVLILEGQYNGKIYYFFHAHMREKSPLSIGIPVVAGQEIGHTGKTGNANSLSSKQTHLHFEVKTQNKRAGYAIDPYNVISELRISVNKNPNKETQK